MYAAEQPCTLTDLERMWMRLKLFMQHRPEMCAAVYETFDGQERTLFDMDSHREEMKKDVSRMTQFTITVRNCLTLANAAGVCLGTDIEENERVFGWVATNNFAVVDLK